MRQFLIFSALIMAVAHAHSPVVMWPAKKFELGDGLSPLESLTPEKFGKMIADQKIVVFAKKGFSLETLSGAKQTPPYLDSQELAALQSVHNLHGLLKQMVLAKNIQYVILEDDDVMKNDAEIKKYMDKYKGYSGMIVTTPIHKISPRAAGDAAPVCALKEKCGLIYVASATEGTKELTSNDCTATCHGETPADGFIIQIGKASFNVSASNGGFSITPSGDLKIQSDITWFPNDFSYTCGSFIARSNNENETLTLNGFQMYVQSENALTKFPDNTWDCTTWFTMPIITGLLIVLFYLSFLFGAVLFLLDIKTNDRFDDPKGKTITVNVAE